MGFHGSVTLSIAELEALIAVLAGHLVVMLVPRFELHRIWLAVIVDCLRRLETRPHWAESLGVLDVGTSPGRIVVVVYRGPEDDARIEQLGVKPRVLWTPFQPVDHRLERFLADGGKVLQ